MRKVVYSFFVIAALSLAGCTLPQMVKMSKDQQLTVTPNPLEVHKDTVTFDMAANLPAKMLKKGTVYTVNTFYKYGEQEVALDQAPLRRGGPSGIVPASPDWRAETRSRR